MVIRGRRSGCPRWRYQISREARNCRPLVLNEIAIGVLDVGELGRGRSLVHYLVFKGPLLFDVDKLMRLGVQSGVVQVVVPIWALRQFLVQVLGYHGHL